MSDDVPKRRENAEGIPDTGRDVLAEAHRAGGRPHWFVRESASGSCTGRTPDSVRHLDREVAGETVEVALARGRRTVGANVQAAVRHGDLMVDNGRPPYKSDKRVRYRVISQHPRPPNYHIEGGEIIEWVWTGRPKTRWHRL